MAKRGRPPKPPQPIIIRQEVPVEPPKPKLPADEKQDMIKQVYVECPKGRKTLARIANKAGLDKGITYYHRPQYRYGR